MSSFVSDFEAFSQSWWPYLITFSISVISAIRVYVGGTYCQSNTRIDGKTVIITGGSSGIGYETAKELAKRGGHIILAIRNAEKGKKAVEAIKKFMPDAEITVRLLDMTDFANIRDFVDQVQKEHHKIDILINNAGVIFQPQKKTVDGCELTLATNYLGPFLLTHLLLPLLNKSDNGRVINLSALAHYNGKVHLDDLNLDKDFNERTAFSQSKLAITIFTKYMAYLFKKTKITFNAANPGLVRNTGHFKNSSLQKSIWTRMSVWPWMWLFLKAPKQGCQTVVHLALDPTLNNVSGCYFSDCEIKQPAEVVSDVKLAQTLYETSCKMVNIDGKKIVEDITKQPKEASEKIEESYNN